MLSKLIDNNHALRNNLLRLYGKRIFNIYRNIKDDMHCEIKLLNNFNRISNKPGCLFNQRVFVFLNI